MHITDAVLSSLRLPSFRNDTRILSESAVEFGSFSFQPSPYVPFNIMETSVYYIALNRGFFWWLRALQAKGGVGLAHRYYSSSGSSYLWRIPAT